MKIHMLIVDRHEQTVEHNTYVTVKLEGRIQSEAEEGKPRVEMEIELKNHPLQKLFRTGYHIEFTFKK